MFSYYPSPTFTIQTHEALKNFSSRPKRPKCFTFKNQTFHWIDFLKNKYCSVSTPRHSNADADRLSCAESVPKNLFDLENSWNEGSICLHTTSRRRHRRRILQRWRRRRQYGRCRLYGQAAGRAQPARYGGGGSRNRMSAPQDCPIRTILLMTTFQGHVALHRRNVNKRRNGHSMTTWAIFRVRYFFLFWPPTYFFLFVTEEILCIVEHKRTLAHYCTHLCQRRTILHRMYPPGKVAISRHLATPRFPQCDHTVGKLSADTGIHWNEA